MERNLIIDVRLKETVIALLEDHRLVELNKEDNTERAFSLRDVYLGKVKKLIPTLNAAFVDMETRKTLSSIIWISASISKHSTILSSRLIQIRILNNFFPPWISVISWRRKGR